MSAETVERVNVFEGVTRPVEDVQEDLSKKAHVISPVMNPGLYEILYAYLGKAPSAKQMVASAIEGGMELVALCQYRWIPTGEAGNHDACNACMAIAANWISEDEG